jgi:hypothetical protein
MKILIKRTKYLAYYFKQLNWSSFLRFFKYVQSQEKKPVLKLWFDIIGSVYKYNISLMDYFYFRFYSKNKKEKLEWAGTGFMYEYQLKMNPKNVRNVLEDKRLFLNLFHDFVNHKHATLDQIKSNAPEFIAVMENNSGKIVFKDALGQCGFGIEIDDAKNWNIKSIVEYMESKGFNLLESFVQQADDLQKLSPSGLNTIRIFTQLNERNEVILLGSRLRITINSKVDNMASGNMAAVIDESTGIVISDGVFSDIIKDNCAIHPVTGIKIKGFQVPFWKETLQLVKKAALLNNNNKSVGWDIAITNEGPELIEGNHNWCKLLWQLPAQKGLKHLLE